VRIPAGRPFVGALTLELLDETGTRIAANFMNLICRPPATAGLDDSEGAGPRQGPRVEVLGPRLAAVRFDPAEFASFRGDQLGWDWLEDRGKLYAYGACEVEYHLALPEFIRAAIPTQIVLMAELATKADDERLDWPSVRRPLDYPQTQSRKHPGTVVARLGDRDLWQFRLADDPADSRGVLSHHARYHHGSFGQLLRRKADLADHAGLREALREKPFVPLSLRTAGAHGLTIYSRRLGRFPVDPTLIVQTGRDLTRPVGWTSHQPVTVHRLVDESRVVHGVRIAKEGGHTWRYATTKPGSDWSEPSFDDSSWKVGRGGFGRQAGAGERVQTPWTTSDIWLRSEMMLPKRPVGAVLQYRCDEEADVYVNGKRWPQLSSSPREYRRRPLRKAELELLREGRNTLAVHCRHRQGRGIIDLGVSWIEIGQAR
jgi:hypothetical protein